MKKTRPGRTIAAFWRGVKRTDGCWLWTGPADEDGYGLVGRGWNLPRRAHRASWTIHRGPIPAGAIVRHTCDVPACVNPDHLRIGTQRDNIRDCIERGRFPRGSAHGRAKLSDVDAAEIHLRHRRGESKRGLGRHFGVSARAVDFVLRGDTWTDLTEATFAKAVKRLERGWTTQLPGIASKPMVQEGLALDTSVADQDGPTAEDEAGPDAWARDAELDARCDEIDAREAQDETP